jgi:cytochrome c1
MKTLRTIAAIAALAFAGSTWAYQVTGPVLEVTDTKIVVQKGKEKWEIARTPDTKVNGDLKVGSKVTVEYTMSAKSVDVKKK